MSIKEKIWQMTKHNMENEKHLLYQDLPSIKPRVSRDERLSMKRQSHCADCTPAINKAKQGAKNLYFFYLAVLAIGFVGIQLHLKNQKSNSSSIKTQSKHISISLSQKINITLIDQDQRYGLSILFRNNSSNIWEIKSINLRIADSEFTKEIDINTSVDSDSFYSVFIPFEQKINNIKNVEVLINS